MGASSNHLELPDPRQRLQSYTSLLNAARVALHKFQHEEAITHCEAALKFPRLRAEQEAAVRCLMAEALDNLSHFSEALQVLHRYEPEAARALLTPLMQCEVCLRLGSAYGGTTEIPQAISFARQALALAGPPNEPTFIGKCHLLLGTQYRRLGELWFARDHLAKAIEAASRSGDQILLAQAYNGLGIVSSLEDQPDSARDAFSQAHEALAEADAPLLRGSLKVNLAAIAALQGRLRESVTLLEGAVPELERARHPRLIVNARSNYGYSLLRLGETGRAREVLEQALAEARDCEALLIAASTLESLGELHAMQGEFEQAEELLGQSLGILKSICVGFNEAMALLTRGRCLLLAGKAAEATGSFVASGEISERMGDPRGKAAARLYLIEAHLASGNLAEAQRLLTEVSPEVERLANTPLIGHLREVSGHLALANGHETEAIRYFNQAVSIQEMLEDRYRSAVARYHLGCAYAHHQDHDRAFAALNRARTAFQTLAANPMLVRTEAALKKLHTDDAADRSRRARTTDVIAVLSRLLEAGFSRELLMHEVTRVLHEDFAVSPVIIFRQNSDQSRVPVAYRGCDEREALNLSQRVTAEASQSTDGEVHRLSDDNDELLLLFLGHHRSALSDSLVALIIKQLRFGLARCHCAPRLGSAAAPGAAPDSHPLSLPGLIYRSEAMRKVVEQIQSLRSSDITVLITGETGTGKELVARAIHAFSNRAEHPFVPFNCAAAPRELIESQIFGHRRGAFTGATADYPGVIGAAEKGTLFLDEIGEMARDLQPKLLRFLQNSEIHRLGETTPRIANARVIAATNRDLEEMIAAGEFRADLYYRLNVIQFHLPPLRERRDEIPLLVEHFMARYTAQFEKQGITLPSSVLSLLNQYDWPGNARQLENEIQRLVALTPAGAGISADLLSPHISKQARIRLVTPLQASAQPLTLAVAVAETERQIISAALTRHNSNISKMADELGVSRFGLRNIMRRHQLAPQRKTAS